jgi:uncharacterized protein
MAVHVSATTGCNLGCTYCYENPDREAKDEWVDKEYDVDAIIDRLADMKERYPKTVPGMHGGEPLLVKTEDLERIFAWIHDNYDFEKLGKNGPHIQTNATLIREEHLDLVEEYDVQVGVSVDGPGELNRHRIAHDGNEEATRRQTRKTHQAIAKMASRGITVGVITVLHEANAGTDERFERLLEWIDGLNRMGVSGHFNPAIPYEDVQTDISLSEERLAEVYVDTYHWMQEEEHRAWNPMMDYVDNLLGNKLGNCVNNRCDVFNAGAAKIVKGNGETTGCGKTWASGGDGGAFLQGPSTGNEYDSDDTRYEAMKQVPGPYTEGMPDMGGCKGCRYWNVCQGGCPGAGRDYDYRNRTVFCGAVYALYEAIERDLRATFPNIVLITDFPWHLDLWKYATRGQLDIEPFQYVRPGSSGRSSAHMGAASRHEQLVETLPDELREQLTFDDRVEMYEQAYGEENVRVDREAGQIHADSAVASGSAETDESDDGWRVVEEGATGD